MGVSSYIRHRKAINMQKQITFEEARQLLFEEAMQSTTLGSYDIDDNLTYSLVPKIIWYEIKLGARRREIFMKAFESQSFVGVAGDTVHVPVYGRDEFTAVSITEDAIDENGYNKTKPTPDSIEISMADVVYVATKISDILLENSPSLGWVRASLQKMGEALTYKREQDIEGVLFAGAGITVAANTGGTLAYDDVIDAIKAMNDQSWYIEEEPFILFTNTEGKADILKAKTASAPFNQERYQDGKLPFKGFNTFAGCIVATSTVVRDLFAYVVAPPTHPFGAAAVAAWKRFPKVEKGRDYQYARDVYILSERRGFGVAHPNGVALISNC